MQDLAATRIKYTTYLRSAGVSACPLPAISYGISGGRAVWSSPFEFFVVVIAVSHIQRIFCARPAEHCLRSPKTQTRRDRSSFVFFANYHSSL